MDKLVEECFKFIKSQNKYIDSLESVLAKPNIVYKYKSKYDKNTVQLFNKYVREIEELKNKLADKDVEIECLKKGYITTEGVYCERRA